MIFPFRRSILSLEGVPFKIVNKCLWVTQFPKPISRQGNYTYVIKHIFIHKFFNQTCTHTHCFNETYIYIYIYIYIHTHTHTHTQSQCFNETRTHTHISFYIYLISWKLICDCWFHAVLLRQSSNRERKKKIEKYCQKNVRHRIACNSLCMGVCVHYICVLPWVVVCVCVCVCVWWYTHCGADLRLSPKYMSSNV